MNNKLHNVCGFVVSVPVFAHISIGLLLESVHYFRRWPKNIRVRNDLDEGLGGGIVDFV